MSQQTNDTVLNLLLDLEASYESLSTRITPEITAQALRSMMDASLVLIPRIIETFKTNDEDWIFKDVVGIGQFAMTETLKSEEYRRAVSLLLDDQFIDETRKIHQASMALSVDDYRYFLLTAGRSARSGRRRSSDRSAASSWANGARSSWPLSKSSCASTDCSMRTRRTGDADGQIDQPRWENTV